MKKIIPIAIALMVLLVGCNENNLDKEIVSAPESKSLSSTNINDANSKEEKIDFPTLIECFNEITKTPRKSGTDGEKRALEYLSKQLNDYGYTTQVQTFDIVKMTNKERAGTDYFDINPLGKEPEGQASNLIADLNYDESKKTMVFSAHYDTTADSVGALDNGGGTAALLDAAKRISIQTLDYNVRVIFFSGEEQGLCGSRYYLSKLSEKELSNITGCLNVDVVGAKDCRKVVLQTSPKNGETPPEDNWISKEFGRINGEYEIKVGYSSDHAPFNKKGITGVQLATVNQYDEGFNADLLRKELNTDSISQENLQKDADMVFEFMKNIDISAFES